MKNKFKILSVAVICLFTVQAFAQFSRNDAISLVQNTILAGDMGKVDVYASTGLISGNVHRVDNETVEVPYSGSWVFFVDDKPWAGWFHDCRYIFVNGQNGEYSIVNSTIYPKNQAIGYELINEATGNGQADLGVATGTQVDGLPPNDHYFAVIICVEDYQENWNDLSLVYNTLIDIYGYKNGNIFVHYGEDGTSGTTYGGDLDNDDLNDLDYSAFSTDIHATFNELAGITSLNNDIPVLDVDDQLAIFVVDAPTLDVLPGTTLWGFWDDNGGGPYIDLEDPLEVAQIVDQINCAQMIMTFSFNFAGGVIDEFEDLSGQANCSARYIHACNFYEEKHSEQYITGGTYGEYFYYWAAAARGVYPDLYPWEPGIDAGSFDFTSITGLENHPGDYDPDENGDGYVQMEEAFNYANAMDTWSNDGYYYNPYVPGEVEVPLDDNGLPFIDDVMTLAGYAGLIETTDIYGGNFVIGGNLSFGPVTLPYKFELDDNTGLYMVNPQASITILENSKVDLGSDMIIAGNSITNKFTVQGRLTTSGTGIEFKGIDGGQWKGLVYDDATEWNFNTFYLSSFTDCLISGNTKSLTLNTIEFINSGIYLAVSKITVSNSVFTNSYADLTHNFSGYEYLHFFRNKFWGEGIIKPAVKLNSFPNFHLFDTYINDHSGGINIYNSGTGTADHLIKVCYIHLCSGAGIKIYHSTADLQNNKSKDNDYGVMVYNNSNVGVFGNEFAWYTGETQLFKDNDSYEFYCSRSSFPHTFRWNAIIDEDNTEPMVYVSGYEYPLDVRNNAWGNNFDPQEDLFPWVAYIYEPVWTLTYDSSEENLAESLYFSSTAA